jgi:uncharacterized protein YecE (DUF72 family)
MTRRKPQLKIGTSGWQYDHWRGAFYPEQMPKRQWFGHYARHFDTVEINNTFYHLPAVSTFESWRESAPEDFCYVLKYSRYGSHIKRLTDPRSHIDTFVEGARRLDYFLGPILVQLPPRWHADPDRLDKFLEVAPTDMKWAIEFRNQSWLNQNIYRILRTHNAALCIHDLIENHPREVTADWIYLRYHGAGEKYGGCYSTQKLSAESRKIQDWFKEGFDVFAYFNNDAQGYAVQNAADLKRFCTGD